MGETTVAAENMVGEYRVTTLVTGGIWKENCHLIRHIHTEELALIDPGEDDGRISTLLQSLGGRLRFILLTHAHHDHVGAVASLSRQFHVACHVHRGDVRLLHHAPMYAWRFANKRIETPMPFVVHEDQPKMSLGGHWIGVVHTPGHTMGSVCYTLPGAVFTGDTLLFQHVGRVDLPGGDAQSIRTSVDHLMQLLPPETVLFPGHGRSWDIGGARAWWTNITASLPQYSEPSTQSVNQWGPRD